MTIREYIRRRSQRAFGLAGAALVGASAGFVHWPLASAGVMYSILLVLTFSIAFMFLRMTKCPRCHIRLEGSARGAARETPTVDNCPHCRVSLDEPMSTALPR
jgi:hypothetical protein